MPRGTCWYGYEQKGMKKKGNKLVPNCVKKAAEGKFFKSMTPKQRLENLKKEKEKIKEEENIRKEYDIFRGMDDVEREEDNFDSFKRFREDYIKKKKGLLVKKGGFINMTKDSNYYKGIL